MAEVSASPVVKPAPAPAPATVFPKASRDVAVPVLLSESAANEVMITWFQGEFAAANAIIDALCGHIIQTFGSEYEAVMAAIHRRRFNWIPVLHMQRYHSIAEVTTELQKATAMRLEKAQEQEIMTETEMKVCSEGDSQSFTEKVMESEENGGGGLEATDDDSPSSDITDSGSREEQPVEDNISLLCPENGGEDSDSPASLIKMTKRFAAKEHVRGHRVNVVKGLKLYENVFTTTQVSKLMNFVNQLRESGRNGELSGETFVLFNKNTKGNKRELIQLGVPIFGHSKDDHSVSIQPIPHLLQSVIDHLLQSNLIPDYKRPNGCVINFFDEDEHSQPFQKPPHVDQPITTLVLSESTMVFGHRLGVDNDNNFRGSLTLSLKQGSLLVMRGNSAEMARHVICPSPNKRVAITFFKLKPDSNILQQPTNPDLGPVTMWRPGSPAVSLPTPLIRSPVVMLAPAPPAARLDVGSGTGTGVFLPWTAVPRKPTKHLPPRAQRLRLQSSVGDGESTSQEVETEER